MSKELKKLVLVVTVVTAIAVLVILAVISGKVTGHTAANDTSADAINSRVEVTNEVHTSTGYDCVIHYSRPALYELAEKDSYRIYHSRFVITEGIVKHIRAISGVDAAVNGRKYQIYVYRGKAFKWDEIEMLVLDAICEFHAKAQQADGYE